MTVLSFIHVPKTGGTSIEQALYLPRGHHRASQTDGWRFAFVRHPFDRFVSAWHFLKHSTFTRHQQHLTRWATASELATSGEVESLGLDEFQPMVVMLDAPVDFIGRYEELSRDFARLCGEIGLDPPPLPHAHRHEGPRDVLTQEACDCLRVVYAADFARFGYQ